MNKNVRKWPCICRKFGFRAKKVHFIAYFSWTTNFFIQDHHKPCKWTWLIVWNPKLCFICSIQQQNPHLCRSFTLVSAIVLKASMDWPTPTYEFYISVIQKQRYSNLLHYFDHSAKFGRFQSAKYNTMNKNVRKWPCTSRKFGFWVEKLHFIA